MAVFSRSHPRTHMRHSCKPCPGEDAHTGARLQQPANPTTKLTRSPNPTRCHHRPLQPTQPHPTTPYDSSPRPIQPGRRSRSPGPTTPNPRASSWGKDPRKRPTPHRRFGSRGCANVRCEPCSCSHDATRVGCDKLGGIGLGGLDSFSFLEWMCSPLGGVRQDRRS